MLSRTLSALLLIGIALGGCVQMNGPEQLPAAAGLSTWVGFSAPQPAPHDARVLLRRGEQEISTHEVGRWSTAVMVPVPAPGTYTAELRAGAGLLGSLDFEAREPAALAPPGLVGGYESPGTLRRVLGASLGLELQVVDEDLEPLDADDAVRWASGEGDCSSAWYVDGLLRRPDCTPDGPLAVELSDGRLIEGPDYVNIDPEDIGHGWSLSVEQAGAGLDARLADPDGDLWGTGLEGLDRLEEDVDWDEVTPWLAGVDGQDGTPEEWTWNCGWSFRIDPAGDDTHSFTFCVGEACAEATLVGDLDVSSPDCWDDSP